MAAVESRKPKDFTGPLNVFLNRYCQAYENRDVDRFMAFFSENAVENNIPLRQLIPSYLNNFQNITEIEYTIDKANYTLDLNLDNISLNGRFAIKWLRKGDREWRHSRGNIQMGLVANGDSFLVQQLSYQFDKQ